MNAKKTAREAARSAAARDDAYETTVALEAAYLDAYRAMLIAYHGDDTCPAYKAAMLVYRDAFLALEAARVTYLDAEAACYEAAYRTP